MIKKPIIHKLFLLLSAAITLHGTMSLVIFEGVASLRSYTVQSNLLVVVGFMVMAFLSTNNVIRSYISFAVLVCISVTGIVYNFILVPFGGSPMVLDGWGNFVTHLLSMVLAYINYLCLEEKKLFTFKHIWAAIVPSFTYWLTFILIGPVINWFPYFFMNYQSIGWDRVFFWFVIILLFLVGLTIAVVLFDKGRRAKALVSLLSVLLVFAVTIVAFGDRQPQSLVSISYEIEDVSALQPGDSVAFARVLQRDEGIAVGFVFSVNNSGTHLLNYVLYPPSTDIVLTITNEYSGEIAYRSTTPMAVSSGVNERLVLDEGYFVVEWTFTNYENTDGMAFIHFELRK